MSAGWQILDRDVPRACEIAGDSQDISSCSLHKVTTGDRLKALYALGSDLILQVGSFNDG